MSGINKKQLQAKLFSHWEEIGMGLECVGIQTTHVTHQRATMNGHVVTTKALTMLCTIEVKDVCCRYCVLFNTYR